ncbi:MAG TPA: hypothetical protein VNP71_04250 [Thermoplasmata archaeon]|nr:hypothetical protein [Thermoplasmata archaeon]
MGDGLSPENIARTLAAIDEFVRSASTLDWEMPSDLLGSRLDGGGARKRCPRCRGHLVLREPRIYDGALHAGGPIVDLNGAPRSRQARLIGIGLRVSYVEALRGLTEDDVAFFDRISELHRLFGVRSLNRFAPTPVSRP